MLFPTATHNGDIIAVLFDPLSTENVLESFAKLTTHPTVESKIDGIWKNEEKVEEENAQIRYSIIEKIDNFHRAEHMQWCDDR